MPNLKTKEERKAEFIKDLKELLAVHEADMELTYGQYGCGEGTVEVTLSQKYDDQGEEIAEFMIFELDLPLGLENTLGIGNTIY